MARCPECGEPNDRDARFCKNCAAELGDRGREAESRRLVTVIFVDLVGSTAIGEQADPELVRSLQTRYFDAVERRLTAAGGTVEKFIGDAVVGVFGVPRTNEDDALRAVRAAQDVLGAITELNVGTAPALPGLAVRIGINSGEASVGPRTWGQAFVAGDVVNTAARLQQSAQPGEILIGPMTLDLVRARVSFEEVGSLVLRGKSGATQAYRVLGPRAGEVSAAAPFVGREEQLATVVGLLEAEASVRACTAVVIIGQPGIGKSRLVKESLARAETPRRRLTARCSALGDLSGLAPITEIIRGAADLTSNEATVAAIVSTLADHPQANRVAALLGGLLHSAAIPVEEQYWAIRRYLEHAATGQGLALVIEDLQWADSVLLNFLSYLTEFAVEGPIVVVATARPELLTEHSELRGQSGWHFVELDGLSPAASGELVRHVLVSGRLDAATTELLQRRSAGNPLFVQELIAHWIERGALVRQGGDWAASPELPMPPSISATLAARVDRLDAETRRLLATASVIGEVFTWERLRELLPPGEQDASSAGLLRLVRQGEIIPTRGVDDAFRFRHALLRDVVYDGMAKRERLALHERMARILEAAPDQTSVDGEAAGTHLELAATYARAIGEPTKRSGALASQAARHMYRAGRRAAGSGDHERALRLLNRALDLVPSEGIQRAEILWALLGPTASSGMAGARQSIFGELREMASKGGGEFTVISNVIEVSGAIEQLYYAPHDAELDQVRRTVQSAVDSLRTAGDKGALAYALQMLGEVEWTAGNVNLALEACEEGLVAAASEGGWSISYPARTIVTLLEYGPTPIAEGIERARELLGQVEPGLWTAAFIHAELALFYAWADDSLESTKRLERALSLATDVTDPDMRHELFWATGHASHLLGNSQMGLDQLRGAWAHWMAQGHMGNVALLSWDYGRVLWTADDVEGLEEVGRVVREMAGRFDAYGEAAWRGLLSLVALTRGDLVTADDFSRQACSLADETDFLNLRGDLWADRATVRLKAGDTAATAEATSQARDLYAAKQNARALRLLRG